VDRWSWKSPLYAQYTKSPIGFLATKTTLASLSNYMQDGFLYA